MRANCTSFLINELEKSFKILSEIFCFLKNLWLKCVTLDGQIAQLVEQRIENPRVDGSIPPLATIFEQTTLAVVFVYLRHFAHQISILLNFSRQDAPIASKPF